MPAVSDTAPPLTAELQQAEVPPPPKPASPPPPKTVPQPRPTLVPAPPPPLAPNIPAIAAATTARVPDPVETPAAPESPPETSAPPDAPAATTQTAAPEQAASPKPAIERPSSGTIAYDVFYEGSGGSIGRSVQTWHIDATRYRLTSITEPIGLLALFRPYLYAYASEGRIGPAGLQPERFTKRRGRRGAREEVADFDWTRLEITLGPAGSPHKRPLPNGTQDMLSFVFQIARTEPLPGRRTITVTQGSKVEDYVLDIGPAEMLDLPAGPTQAIPIRQIAAPGADRMELWLTVEPPRLPVRIRIFDREGRMFEQLARKIDIDAS